MRPGRRRAVISIASGIVAPLAGCQSGPPSSTSERTADSWVQDWQRRKEEGIDKPLSGPFDLRRFRDPMYVLLGQIAWRPKQPGIEPMEVSVPRGFVTDFASIPRVFWSLFRPDGNYAYAAVIHDYLYWSQERPKAEADKIFRLAMDDLKIKDWQSSVLHAAVATFGDSAWASNAELRKAGEKRILMTLPEDSTIDWAEWKRKPSVFG